MSYFYGIAPHILEEYSESFILKMWDCVTRIEAQEQLRMFTVQDWSHMKKGQRQKLHKEMHRLAFPSDLAPKKYVTIEDVQKVLGR